MEAAVPLRGRNAPKTGLLWAGLILALSLGPAAATNCIGPAPVQRRLVVGGEELPIRVAQHNWDSHRVTSHLVATLLEGALGYPVAIVPGSDSVIHSIARIAGCSKAQGYASCCWPEEDEEAWTATAPACRLEDRPSLDAPEAMVNPELWSYNKKVRARRGWMRRRGRVTGERGHGSGFTHP